MESSAPPTDTELREHGLGIPVLSPPPLVAWEIGQHYSQYKQQSHPAGYPAGHTHAHVSRSHESSVGSAAAATTLQSPRGVSSTPPPSEVQVAIAMSRAEKWKQSLDTGSQADAGTSSHMPSKSVGSAGLASFSKHQRNSTASPLPAPGGIECASSNGEEGPRGGNRYSLGGALPQGVSWRYVDVLHNNSSSNSSNNSNV